MQKRMKLLKNQKGMTLVELLAVLVILGIIAAIAIPMIGNVINESRDKALLSDAQTILNGANIAYSNEVSNSTTFWTKGKSDLEKYVDGIDSTVDYSVKFKDGEWYIYYAGLTGIKTEKFAVAKDGYITADNLKKLLKGQSVDENNDIDKDKYDKIN
ncbi:type II secretion system protein [Caldifermentibacillus hisashii]|uniref:type II secretion system protein n=1 Tax=Caldifermentibacillus hisashii TaxID=996558 RepID=UPI0031FBB5F4